MVIHHTELANLREINSDICIAYSGGVFDLLNLGHLQLFERLRKSGDITVVGVTPNSRATYRKGPTRPVNNEATRLAIVNAMRDVDHAFISPEQPQDGDEYIGYEVLRSLKPNVFFD